MTGIGQRAMQVMGAYAESGRAFQLVNVVDDSGTVNAPVTYAAYPSEKPVVSGGMSIKGWRPTVVAGRNLWLRTYPLKGKRANSL